MLNIFKLKSVLFKNFENQKVYICTTGIVSINFSIDEVKIIANSRRIILGSNNEKDFIIDLFKAKKVQIDKSNFKITFTYDELEVELQV
jgi:hypothetical protein